MAIAGIILGSWTTVVTIIVYVVFYFFNSGTGSFAEAKIDAIEQAVIQEAGYLELYKKSEGKYPKSLDELTQKGYSTILIDFYGPLYYKLSADGQSYDLRALGPDGKYGTNDDILPSSSLKPKITSSVQKIIPNLITTNLSWNVPLGDLTSHDEAEIKKALLKRYTSSPLKNPTAFIAGDQLDSPDLFSLSQVSYDPQTMEFDPAAGSHIYALYSSKGWMIVTPEDNNFCSLIYPLLSQITQYYYTDCKK